jgi:hypothetical protein
MGPTCYPTTRVPELEKALEAVEESTLKETSLSCKLINTCFKKKVGVVFGQIM